MTAERKVTYWQQQAFMYFSAHATVDIEVFFEELLISVLSMTGAAIMHICIHSYESAPNKAFSMLPRK